MLTKSIEEIRCDEEMKRRGRRPHFSHVYGTHSKWLMTTWRQKSTSNSTTRHPPSHQDHGPTPPSRIDPDTGGDDALVGDAQSETKCDDEVQIQ
jgi:hypothetical protein